MIIAVSVDLRIVAEDGHNYVVMKRGDKGWKRVGYYPDLRCAVVGCLRVLPHADPEKLSLVKALDKLDRIAREILEACDGALSARQAVVVDREMFDSFEEEPDE